MMNTRLSVATHILTFLQTQNGQPVTSAFIASSVNTNASYIRRLLTQLSRAGLTVSQFGAGGGTFLARAADRITLLDVYKAVSQEGEVLAIHQTPNPRCPVGRNINQVLKQRLHAAELSLMQELSRTTIADMASDIRKLTPSDQHR